MLATKIKLKARLKSLTEYITPLLPLTNCHMVEFLTKKHWKKLLPPHLRLELEGFDRIWDFGFTLSRFWDRETTLCHDNTALGVFIQVANYFTLNEVDYGNKYIISRAQLQDKLASWGGRARQEINISAFMNSKKSYEVATMSRLVASLYEATSSTCCLEAGGGRGHLLVALSMGYQIPSLTVDYDEDKLRAAASRVKLIQKQWRAITTRKDENKTTAQDPTLENRTDKQDDADRYSKCSHESSNSLSCPPDYTIPLDSTSPDDSSTPERNFFHPDVKPATLHRFAMEYITKNSNLVGLVEDKFPELIDNVKILLTGLHTCGDLGPSSLRIFASHPSTAAVFNVPCCYHLLTEGLGEDSGFPMSKYLKGFKLGRNTRMLAAQSMDRVVKEQKFPPKSLLYRAMLEVLIKKHFDNASITENKLKRISSKCNTFEEYLKMSDDILKLGLSSLPQSSITEVCKDMDLQWRRLVTFYMLRLCLAPVIENIILLDRLMFLLENDYDKVFVVKLFDPILSPRCHGIVALK